MSGHFSGGLDQSWTVILRVTDAATGELLRELDIDLTRDHQPRRRGRAGTAGRRRVRARCRRRRYEQLAVSAEPGHVLLVYTAEPGSPSAERMRLLASLAAGESAAAALLPSGERGPA